MIVHLVLFKLKSDSLDRKDEIVQRLNALKDLVPSVVDLNAGSDINRSPAAFDIGLYSTFKTSEDLQAYQVHPEHQKVVELIKATTESRVVTDYEIDMGF